MSFQPVRCVAAWFVASSCMAVACSDDRPAPPGSGGSCSACADASAGGASSDAGGSAATPSGGDAGASGGAQGGTGGAAGNAASAGAAGTSAVPECGNGVREEGEACDGSDFGDLSCASYGFSDGELSCDACAASASACSGTELCSDGADNDGDGNADCDDGDCGEECVDFCTSPTPLANGVFTTGAIDGQLAPNASSCSPGPETGQLVFAYDAPLSGVAELFLEGASSELTLSARTTCGESATELACVDSGNGTLDRLLTVAVTQGELVYVIVESPDRDVPSTFSLIASAREVVCGDGYADLAEECDDGNFEDSDGCSNACAFQPDEEEPNATLQTANSYAPPEFFGAIASADDVDVISVSLSAGQHLVVETFDLGDGACARLELDDWIDVLDGAGNVIESDDDDGIGFCAALVTSPLGAGTHYVRVRASGAAQSFFYRLQIRVEG